MCLSLTLAVACADDDVSEIPGYSYSEVEDSKITNSSLIGYTSNGNPRIQKDATIDTDFTISNTGTKLVIGGINKKSLMKVSTGLPVLKDIPYIGKLFSTESDVTKNSQMLVVVEVLPKDKADNKQAEIKKIKDTLK